LQSLVQSDQPEARLHVCGGGSWFRSFDVGIV
jgi:hypothetical protein